ncbi:hypothetical protein CRENBAI_026667 [Crenichthys baileyi]|uniref:C-type lectin domain-containing protein n=1 Tax=Crenichthys baileyi TaxID=28760 RepID=A0AAV9R306_9TELE
MPGSHYSADPSFPPLEVCYKEMVTLTPENTHIVTRMINSDHWIGLRKYINYNDTIELDNSTNTSPNISDTPWTLWANGDPLVFQNWYPGYPVFKSLLPKIDCCSCTCLAPIQTTTNPPTVSSVTSQNNGNPTGPNNTTVINNNMTDFTSLLGFENATTVSSVTSQKNGNPTGPNNTTVIYNNMTDFTSLLGFENATTVSSVTSQKNGNPTGPNNTTVIKYKHI